MKTYRHCSGKTHQPTPLWEPVVPILLVVGLFVSGCDPGSDLEDGVGGSGSTVGHSTSSATAPLSVDPSAASSGDLALAGVVEPIGGLEVSRAAHTATRLIDGRVLITGGCSRPGCEGNADAVTAELYDPVVGGFVEGPSMSVPRAGHTATSLADGRVLIVGGYPGEGRGPLASAELFDPVSNEFLPTGDMAQGRGSHTATALDDGRVLIVGGVSERNQLLDSVEVYDPLIGTFRAAARLPDPRATHAAVRLGSGEVLVVGGQSADSDSGHRNHPVV